MKEYNLDIDPKINSGFKVPDGYFENFSERLLLNLPEKQAKIIPFYAKRQNWIYAFAALLLIQISIPVVNNYFFESTNIDQQTIENYITENKSVNENDIASLLTDDDIQQLNNDLKLENKTIENELLNTENLEEIINL